MKNTDFDSKRIARGYVNRPWLHKQVMEQYIKDNALSKKLSHGLDVGCGAGLSTKALRLICDDVTGTDISPAMIEVCKEQYHGNSSYDFYMCNFTRNSMPNDCIGILLIILVAYCIFSICRSIRTTYKFSFSELWMGKCYLYCETKYIGDYNYSFKYFNCWWFIMDSIIFLSYTYIICFVYFGFSICIANNADWNFIKESK